MSLRRSFWNVSGEPCQADINWEKFLDQYAPARDYQGIQFLERHHDAQRNFIHDRYPGMATADAVLLHQQDCRLEGDLYFREIPVGTEIGVGQAVKACAEFRKSCQWWQKGERLTHIAELDAREFATAAKSWTLTKWENHDQNLDATNTLKREIELSCQFAEALLLTIESQKKVLREDQICEGRTQEFRQHLEQVFATFER